MGVLDVLKTPGVAGGLAGAAAGGLFSIPMGFIQAAAASRAAAQQQRAAKEAQGQITGAYDQAQGYQQPYYDVGTENMRTLSQMVGRGDFQTEPYRDQTQQFNYATDPGYQYRMQQGQAQINSAAAAGGMQLSGATMKNLARFGQKFATEEYGNAYDRFAQDRQFRMTNELHRYNTATQQAQQRYGQYAGFAGMGQAAAVTLAGLATGYGQSIADTTLQAGNAAAAGTMGRGDAAAGMFSGMRQGAILGATLASGINPYTGEPLKGGPTAVGVDDIRPSTGAYYG